MPSNDYKNRDKFPRGRGGRGRFNHNRRGGGHDNKRNNKRSYSEVNNSKRPKYESSVRIKEVDIGISEYLGDHQHFDGIFKERFSDFHVHEIDCDGKVAKLTTQEIPPDPEDFIDVEKLRQTLPEDVLEKLDAFISKTDSDENSSALVEIDVTDITKDQRRNIHSIAKKYQKVITQTVEKNNRKLLILSKVSSDKVDKNDPTFKNNVRVNWSLREGPYCKFILHKVNIDTMDALNQLAVNLRIRANNLNYSGTKDRRARTTQWVSVKQIDPSNIFEAARRVRGLFVGNFEFVKNPLKLGTLEGNHFSIALRNITASDEEIESAMTSLRDNGFVNYYGLQRFGSVASIPTYEIGKALLKGNYQEAIDLLLKPRDNDYRDMAEARECYEKTKDAKQALKLIQKPDKIEAKLLQGIAANGPNSPQNALDSIPRNTLLMYIHSYQSLVWNNMVSRRIKEFGRKPIVGDLVYASDSVADKVEVEIEVEESVDENDESKEEPIDNGKDQELEKDKKPLPAVKVLAEEDLANYTLADVVMPQPGYKVTYPTYAKDWYEEFMAKDGLSLDLQNKNRRFSLGGAYRKIVQVPEGLSWRVVQYDDISCDLIRSDFDEMQDKELIIKNSEGKYKALVLEMSLKSSTYATMALREILKQDTSAETQSAQTASYHALAKQEAEDLKESQKKEKLVDKSELPVDDNVKEVEDSAKEDQVVETETKPTD
ncbi:GSCOCG00001385001-RA-CDS [Cotesia congregata]|nr:GSCOCG00001385001-RA-CDS [Cotesia congregata]